MLDWLQSFIFERPTSNLSVSVPTVNSLCPLYICKQFVCNKNTKECEYSDIVDTPWNYRRNSAIIRKYTSISYNPSGVQPSHALLCKHNGWCDIISSYFYLQLHHFCIVKSMCDLMCCNVELLFIYYLQGQYFCFVLCNMWTLIRMQLRLSQEIGCISTMMISNAHFCVALDLFCWIRMSIQLWCSEIKR